MVALLGLRIPGVIGRLPIAEIAGRAKSIGLDVLDLPAAFAPGVEACRAAGLGIGSVDGMAGGDLVSADESVRESAVAKVIEQVEAMGKAGLRTMFLCIVPRSDTQPIARSFDYFREVFPAIARACETFGVRIAFEGYPGPAPFYHTLGYTPELWRAMFKAVPSSTLGLCYDPSHLVRLGIDYLRVLEEFSDRIHHCHGKDTALLPEGRYLYGDAEPVLAEAPDFAGGGWRYCIPGSGTVNWAQVADGLHRANYDGCVCIELEDSHYNGSLQGELRGVEKALDHLAIWFR